MAFDKANYEDAVKQVFDRCKGRHQEVIDITLDAIKSNRLTKISVSLQLHLQLILTVKCIYLSNCSHTEFAVLSTLQS